MSLRVRVMLTAVVAVVFAAAPFARAQAPVNGVTLHAARATLHSDDQSVVTAVFSLANSTRDSVRVKAELALPHGWNAVTGLAPTFVAPASSETWISGVALPANVAAGSYVIQASATANGVELRDSIIVVVGERRGLEVHVSEAPGWAAMSGDYESAFVVRNRGNVTSTVKFTGTTSRGVRASAVPASATLAPGATARVIVRVAHSTAIVTTSDDVIELIAADIADPGASAVASTHTLLVSDSRSPARFETVPGMLAVRSSAGAAGVAPVVLSGAGAIGNSKTTVDFLLQAPTNQNAPVGFGERDEYRLSVTSEHARVRLGDQLFGWSPLASSAMLGTGAEVRATGNGMEGGAYVQRPRWSPGVRAEEGFYVGVSADSIARGTATMLVRQPAQGGDVRVASLRGTLRAGHVARVDVEGAASDTAGVRDHALRGRISGAIGRVNYDADAAHGGLMFAGPYRGNDSRGAIIAAQLTPSLSLTTSTRTTEWGAPTLRGALTGEHLTTRNASLSWKGSVTLDYGRLGRRDLTDASIGGTQQGARFTVSHRVSRLMVTAGAERGVVDQTDSARQQAYTQVSASLNADFGKRGAMGVSSTYSSGNTLVGASTGVVNFGINATVKLPLGFEFGMAGSAQRATIGVLDSSGAWFSVMDARLDHRFASGAVMGMHGRTLQSPYVNNGRSQSAVYVEYRTPLRLPVTRAPQRGRVIGRVMHSDDGTPVAGALVRLGTYAAITDRDGRVEFSSVEAASYRVALEAKGDAAGAMLTGDVVVRVPDAATAPTAFSLAVTRGAQVAATVRTLARAGSVGAAADSLVDAGAATGFLVRLESARDTLYQTSDDQGRVNFGRVTPGTYTVAIRASDAPANAKFDRELVQIAVAAGEKQMVDFRLLPQQRTIKILESHGEVKAK